MNILKFCLIACFSGLCCCLSNDNPPQAGGINDFPNSHTTASALGETIANNLLQVASWSDSISLPPATSPAPIAQLASVPIFPQHITAGISSLDYDFSDTLHGIVRAIYRFGSESDILYKCDTFFIKYDDMFLDTLPDNERIYMIKGVIINQNGHNSSMYMFRDSDGDSIINNQNGKPNRMFASITHSFQLHPVRNYQIEIDGGEDCNLVTQNDMRIMQCQFFEVNDSGDTVLLERFESYNGNPVIVSVSARDSSLIRKQLMIRDSDGRWMTTQVVYLIFPSDSTKNRTVYFQNNNLLNGTISKHYCIRGLTTDSLFFPADTALVYFNTEMSGDEGWSDTIRMRIIIGEQTASNRLIEFYHHHINRYAGEKEVTFTLIPYNPIPEDTTIQQGSYTFKTVYNDNDWITADGECTSNRIRAVYKDADGYSLQLEWDRKGIPQ